MSWELRTGSLLRWLAIVALGWAPAMLGLVLLERGSLGARAALTIGLAGGVAAAALVCSRVIRRREPKLVPRAAGGGAGAVSWAAVANPRGSYANRWAAYERLSAWLAGRDWTGKTIAEFGHTNDVLKPFIRGGRHVMLEYPEHDVQRLDRVADDQFDLAILDQTLEHVADPERALGEVHRVLKPGGVAIVTTPFLVPLHSTSDYGDYTRWTPQGMKTMLERRGFEAEVESWGNLAAAKALLGDMYLTAEDAKRLGLGIEAADGEPLYPVTLWAFATARKGDGGL